MSNLAKKLIGESDKPKEKPGHEQETRTYTVSSQARHLDLIEHMFRWMNMTAGGHSGSMLLSIDGDGAGRVKVERDGKDLAEPEEDFVPKSQGDPEFKVCLDSLDTPKLIIEAYETTPIQVCPHCRHKIFEKHTYVRDGVERHSDCKGALKRPPYDWSGTDPQWRALLEPHMNDGVADQQ